MTIEVPEWCVIGKKIQWKDMYGVATDDRSWCTDTIISFGYDGFFHQAHNCPVYYSKFDEYGKTIREVKSESGKKI